MTALGEVGHGRTPARHPLAPGAGAGAIRHHLLREDRKDFDLAFSRARASANEDELLQCLEHWRRVAIVQQDRDEFVRIARRAAERITGEPSPPGEPLAVTRAKAGM